MNFSEALVKLKSGEKISRSGWNGKGMFLFLIERWQWENVIDGKDVAGVGLDYDLIQLPVLPFIVMKTADNKIVPWLASQTDLLADDWGVVE